MKNLEKRENYEISSITSGLWLGITVYFAFIRLFEHQRKKEECTKNTIQEWDEKQQIWTRSAKAKADSFCVHWPWVACTIALIWNSYGNNRDSLFLCLLGKNAGDFCRFCFHFFLTFSVLYPRMRCRVV